MHAKNSDFKHQVYAQGRILPYRAFLSRQVEAWGASQHDGKDHILKGNS